MILGMLIVGALFGVALSVSVALFAVLSMGGNVRLNIRRATRELRVWLTGRHRRRQTQAAPPVENENRIRALQDEIRIMQRLMSQAQAAREAHASEMRKAAEEIATLRSAASTRDERLAELEAALHAETTKVAPMRAELAALAGELARSRREVKDLETELSVLQSGDGLKAISEEVARLSAERDDLTTRLARLTRPVALAK